MSIARIGELGLVRGGSLPLPRVTFALAGFSCIFGFLSCLKESQLTLNVHIYVDRHVFDLAMTASRNDFTHILYFATMHSS